MQYLLVTSRGLCSDSELVRRCRFFSLQVYLTVLKHGDSATLDTMLKVRLAGRNVAPARDLPAVRRSSLTPAVVFSFRFFLFRSFRSAVNQLHKQADMQEEKNRIERVLGAISAPDLIQKVLSFALSVPGAHLEFRPSTRWHRCDDSKTES